MIRLSTLLLMVALALPAPAPARRLFGNAVKLSLIAIHVTHDPTLPEAYDGIVPSIVDATVALAPHLKFLSPAEWSEQLGEQHTAMFIDNCGGNRETCGASSFLGRLGVSHVLRVSIRRGETPETAKVTATLFTVGFRQPPRQQSVVAPPDQARVSRAATEAIAALLHIDYARAVLPGDPMASPPSLPPWWIKATCWVEEMETGPVGFAVGVAMNEESARARAIDRLGHCLHPTSIEAVEYVDTWTGPDGALYRLARWQPTDRPAATKPKWKSWADIPRFSITLVDPVARAAHSVVSEALRSRGAKAMAIHGTRIAAHQLRSPMIVAVGGRVNGAQRAEIWIAAREKTALSDTVRVSGKGRSKQSEDEAIARAVTNAFEQLDNSLFPKGYSPFAAAWSPTAAGFEQRGRVVGKVDIDAIDLREGAREPGWFDGDERVWADGTTRFAIGRVTGDPEHLGLAVRAALANARQLLTQEFPDGRGEVVFLDFCFWKLQVYVLVGRAAD